MNIAEKVLSLLTPVPHQSFVIKIKPFQCSVAATFSSASYSAFFQLNDFELRKGKKLGVTISFNNHRLFVGNIPKNRDRDELIEEFSKHAREYKSTW